MDSRQRFDDDGTSLSVQLRVPISTAPFRQWLRPSRRGWLLLLPVCFAVAAVDSGRMETLLQSRFGSKPLKAFQAWRQTVTETRSLADLERLERINGFFNRHLAFLDDQVLWNEADYWATPLEAIGRAAGDCEDFAVAKYFSLIEAGVEKNKLRLTYVKARIGGPTSTVTQAHMVLTYYATPQAEPLVLDNLIGEIRPASRRPDLLPVFSFNRDGVYVGGAAPAPVERLSRWTNLILRMQAQGYDP
ncbi:transglutaminase-like cysteine peptidase [Chitiniphilus purpureus]|uniref:Transglutaminase-like cysteine peptidase n=1 Tax=Chitiniphilus purpureus TaxID=2981137 RepID=A0ABY6DIR2_9NEIS|nr:transglutaminase-like cysteine peptidase [Chitiniphilus sp. CD1]UXY14235.1 transglutaminase-like cysteine peptidase [Chitiniphilus sp. CD1]